MSFEAGALSAQAATLADLQARIAAKKAEQHVAEDEDAEP